MNDKVAEGVERVIDFGVSVLQSVDEKKRDEAYNEAIEIGISNMIFALFEAKVDNDKICQLLNKYWGIEYNEAQKRLHFEMPEFSKRELRRYLQMEGFSAIEIAQFLSNTNAIQRIRHEHELWKLNPDKLKKELEKNLKK